MKKLILIFLFLFTLCNVFSQSGKISKRGLTSESYAYNFMIGKDTKNFQTTVRSFGSGLFDFSFTYGIINFWILNPEKRAIGIFTSLGTSFLKYKFNKNLIFNVNDNTITEDTVSSHYYKTTFFSNNGSKLVIGRLEIPLYIYLPVSNWFGEKDNNFGIFGGLIYRPYIFSYHRLQYYENNLLYKQTTPDYLMTNFFNKNDIAVKAGIKLYSFWLFGQYSITNLFSDNKDIHEARIGINFIFGGSSNIWDKIKDKASDYETEAK